MANQKKRICKRGHDTFITGRDKSSRECTECRRARKKGILNDLPILPEPPREIPTTKFCPKCKIVKPILDFYSAPERSDGFSGHCKDCSLKAGLNWKHKNREIHNATGRKWHQEHNEQSHANGKRWRMHNKERSRISLNERRKTNIQFKLAYLLRSRLRSALKHNAKTGSAVRDLGCSVDFLKDYLQSKFLPGMSWSNHGFGADKWHIDHIIPLVSFDLTDREQLLKAVHYTNLQPMWQIDNLKKHDKIL